MTLSSAPRPDDPTATSRCQSDLDAARPPATPPDGAISLADLVTDSGPLPPDAVLECIQRLAELLCDQPAVPPQSLNTSNVLIDDDGGVWLRDASELTTVAETSRPHEPADVSRRITSDGMNRIGRMIACLVSGDLRHENDETGLDAATLPAPLSAVTGRLFSRNGACYPSYAALATDAAALRGTAEAHAVAEDISSTSAAIDHPAHLDDDRLPETDRAATSGIGMIALVVVILAACIAIAIWQSL